MSQPKITLYVDVNEPVFKSVQVTYIPIFLGGLMKACGNTAPIYVKNKDKWIQTERNRWAQTFNVPMSESSPPNFPPLTISLMRALCVLSAHEGEGANGQELLARALAQLWPEFWVRHAEIAKPEVFGPILRHVVGEELAEKVIAQAGTTGKELLQKNTDKAFEAGAFGLPWFVATNSEGRSEGFWGVDHVGQVLQFLGIDKPADGGWKAVL